MLHQKVTGLNLKTSKAATEVLVQAVETHTELFNKPKRVK